MSDCLVEVPLREIAHGRTGDKGDRSNVSVIPYADDGYAPIDKQVTAERMRAAFAQLLISRLSCSNLCLKLLRTAFRSVSYSPACRATAADPPRRFIELGPERRLLGLRAQARALVREAGDRAPEAEHVGDVGRAALAEEARPAG